jgi:hypothetical protein
MHGEGVYTMPDGRVNKGAYKYDLKHGYGVFEWGNGKKYKGFWENGVQHDEGEYYDSLKKICERGN